MDPPAAVIFARRRTTESTSASGLHAEFAGAEHATSGIANGVLGDEILDRDLAALGKSSPSLPTFTTWYSTRKGS